MRIARRNHYVPVWYQKLFLPAGYSSFYYVDLSPEIRVLPDGQVIPHRGYSQWGPKKCFWEKDLYTTSYFGKPNDEIERFLFGDIDAAGAATVRALIGNDAYQFHTRFIKFFEYLNAQKIRTPKGLDWIKTKYLHLSQSELMREMQGIRQMYCTMWAEAVREIVSAEDSGVKFIITDHPVTIYNPVCPPQSRYCQYPDDPSIVFKGSQTISPLDYNHCLILTNLEYAQEPQRSDLLAKRTNARYFGQTMSRTDTMIRSRRFKEEHVIAINHILKARAHRYIAAANKEWLNPEFTLKGSWAELGRVLLPPEDELGSFGGEIYVGYEDGSTSFQDAFSRTSKSTTSELSIRERNLKFIEAVFKILGLRNGKTWEDVRRELSDEQVKNIHKVLGYLWPKETNVVDLLPKPDPKVLRTLYTGIVDPRTIIKNVANFSLYFDEILVINPFMNPVAVNAEYSPEHSPSQYKQETLKNVFLLIQLTPFIKAGIVNLIPDPCDFSFSLRSQIQEMEQKRPECLKVDAELCKPMKALFEDDFLRSLYRLSDESIKRTLKTSSPGLSDKEIEGVLGYMKQKCFDDPLALLQPVTHGESSGQLHIMKLIPNFELAFFLAQITGSILYTDHHFRWREITGAVNCMGRQQESSWELLPRHIGELGFIFNNDSIVNLEMREMEEIGLLRNVLRKIVVCVHSEHDPVQIKVLDKKLSGELEDAYAKSKMKLKSIQKKTDNYYGKIDCVIPVSGFGVNTVHRLLLSYGSIEYWKTVPMAMFVKYD